jgi:hypothetical protein
MSDVAVNEVVFLLGRPPATEYMGYVSSMTVDGATAEKGVLANEWRVANDHIKALEQAEAGIADGISVGLLDVSLDALSKAAFSDPFFSRNYSLMPASLGVVELDKLVVFQKQINLTYAKQLEAALVKPATPEAVFRFCLPLDHPITPVRSGRIAANQFLFYSDSTDFRVLDATVLTPAEVGTHQFDGPVAGVVGVALGFGPNFVSVVEAEGRLVLSNGSHRAYALRSAGITHAPCVIQKMSRRDELEFVGSEELRQRPDDFLKNARPPLLKDYFDPALRSVLRVPRRARQLKVTVSVELADVPLS